MRSDLPVIDAEFEVIDIGDGLANDPPAGRWTFWRDDFPNLFGLAGGFVILFLMKAYVLPHIPTWSSLIHH